ncbi:hypothetical protein B0H13DRAFT_2292420 [Mycena leptocephala]|nr:hypothetical protein B0H13DRAFT_2292420 [Mycena leptocephala]
MKHQEGGTRTLALRAYPPSTSGVRGWVESGVVPSPKLSTPSPFTSHPSVPMATSQTKTEWEERRDGLGPGIHPDQSRVNLHLAPGSTAPLFLYLCTQIALRAHIHPHVCGLNGLYPLKPPHGCILAPRIILVKSLPRANPPPHLTPRASASKARHRGGSGTRSHDYIVVSRSPSSLRSVRLCTSTTRTGLHPPALDAAPPAPPDHAPLRTHTSPFGGKAPIRVSTYTLTDIRGACTQCRKSGEDLRPTHEGTHICSRAARRYTSSTICPPSKEGIAAAGTLNRHLAPFSLGLRQSRQRREGSEDNQCVHLEKEMHMSRILEQSREKGERQVGIKKGKERERKGREEREATRTQHAAREKGVLETTRRCVSKMITERSEGRKGRRVGARRARPGRGEGGEAREKWREYERAPRFTPVNARARCEKSPERETEAHRKIICKITRLVRADPYLHHFRSNTSESRAPSRSRKVGIVICGTRKYGVKGRRDGEKRVFMRVKHGLGSRRREGSPRHEGRSSRWHACKMSEEALRGIPSGSPAPSLVASSPDPERQFHRLKGARLRVDTPLSPRSAGLAAQTEKARKHAPRFTASFQRRARR